FPGSGIAVNLSGASLADDSLQTFIINELDRHGVQPERICFELTEAATMQNLSHARRLVEGLRERGCRFSLDDFGSGLSSFGYLKHLPIDYVKIDASFVREMVNDSVDAALVAAINELVHTLGVRSIAEGVDRHDTLERLRALGVDYVQGYAVDFPRPLEQILRSAA
ncbi:MAG: EAL domain-containing protein, partial [Gammaproteobacteria bacterium]|nr:EAL domain-containing protein [Gammaproteobacteria bacterium]